MMLKLFILNARIFSSKPTEKTVICTSRVSYLNAFSRQADKGQTGPGLMCQLKVVRDSVPASVANVGIKT